MVTYFGVTALTVLVEILVKKVCSTIIVATDCLLIITQFLRLVGSVGSRACTKGAGMGRHACALWTTCHDLVTLSFCLRQMLPLSIIMPLCGVSIEINVILCLKKRLDRKNNNLP